MASQSEPITTTDVLDYIDDIFYIGATYGKAPALTRQGLSRAADGFPATYKVATANQFPMGNELAGDAAAQDGVTEDNSIGAGSNTSYTVSQNTQYMQIFQYYYILSYARIALSGAISGVAIAGQPLAGVGTLGVQREAHLRQALADFEYSALRGTGQAWTNAATAGKMGGLVTAIEAGSETAAGGATLSKSLIKTEIERMAAAGAEFGDMVVMANAHQINILNDLYGNPPMSMGVGGTMVSTINFPLMGPTEVMYNPTLATDDLVFVDYNHFMPVFGIVEGKGTVIVEPMARTTAAQREMLFFIASIDYDSTKFHGMVSGLATS